MLHVVDVGHFCVLQITCRFTCKILTWFPCCQRFRSTEFESFERGLRPALPSTPVSGDDRVSVMSESSVKVEEVSEVDSSRCSSKRSSVSEPSSVLSRRVESDNGGVLALRRRSTNRYATVC